MKKTSFSADFMPVADKKPQPDLTSLLFSKQNPVKITYLWTPERETDYMIRIAQGDKDAFSEIVKLYLGDIFHFACSIIGDKAKAEDITQDACLKLWLHAKKWSPEGRIKNWLFRITHNLCIDELRKRKKEYDIDDFIFALPDHGDDGFAYYAQNQLAKLVTKSLFQLPERQRTAMTLVHYSGYGNIEAAAIMQVSIEAMESLLSRGKANLKTILADYKKLIFD